MSTPRTYILVTPSWCVNAGVRVIHTLCHELNSLGYDARLLLTSNLSNDGPVVNPLFNTPVVNPIFEADWPVLNQNSIMIYPDGVLGNPFGARRVARYILGKEVPREDDNPDEYRFYYSRAFAAKRASSNRVLFWVPSDQGDFNDKNTGARTQDMLWLGKGAKYCTEKPPNVVDITYSWPPSRRELAAQLRQTRYLYSYDTLSTTNLEAILCGAVVIMKCFKYYDSAWTRQDLDAMEHGSGGYAFGDSDFEIDRAVRTQQETVDSIRYHNARLRSRLIEFVDETQYFFRF